MRQMTLDQIDLQGNGFHEALNAFIISHTMESLRKLKSIDAANLCSQVHYMKGECTVKSKSCIITHCSNLMLSNFVNDLMTLKSLLSSHVSCLVFFFTISTILKENTK